MATPAMTGAIGWAPQAAKGTAGLAANTYWHKALEASLFPVQLDRVMPMEIGGSPLPSGSYKGGYYAAGDILLAPRANKALGFLLYCFAGSVSATGSGPYMHIFPGVADTVLPTKYMTFKRIVPVSSGSTLGESFVDCRVVSLSIDANAGNILNARVGLVGLNIVPTDAPSGAGWLPNSDNGGYDDYTYVPIATRSTFEMPDGTPITNITNAQVNFALGMPNPESELVLGQYNPDDTTPLSRTITVQATFKWKDSTMWKNIYYNGGATWSPIVWTGGQPFEINFSTPTLVHSSQPGILGLWAQKMHWVCRPTALRGGDIITMQITGTVIDANSGEDWRLYLQNSLTAYTWPT